MFDEKGNLNLGVHDFSINQFVDTFCTGDVRSSYKKTVVDLYRLAEQHGASYMLVGGSFITQVNSPNDFDVVLVFPEYEYVPGFNQSTLVADIELDILVCCSKDTKTVQAFSNLLAFDKSNLKRGVARILIERSNSDLLDIYKVDSDQYEYVKKAYTNKRFVSRDNKRGVLITVHGVLSHGTWTYQLTPIANDQGWIVAPFYYGNTWPTVLVSDWQRKKIKSDFRDFLFKIYSTYQDRLGISILAHSFGSWLVGSYFHDFKSSKMPVEIQSIILAGSILSENIVWDQFSENVGSIRNEIGLDDPWVKLMPRCKYPGKDKLFGRAGTNGFANDSFLLEQVRTEGFDHSNAFKEDVIKTRWLPFLNANRLSLENRRTDAYLSKLVK